MSKELKSYIDLMREHGYSDERIREELKSVGWMDEHLDPHFAHEPEVIRIQNLKKYFGSKKAVDNVTLSVRRGEVFGFLGPNGAGKTTTIRCMMDLMRPDDGFIAILGKDSRDSSVELKRNIGYLSGDVGLYDKWTGKEHIEFLRKLHNKEDVADELIERLGFDVSVPTKKLSSGNRQKLGVIIAFMFKPKVLILDEPTNALDPLLQNTLYELFAEMRDVGSTIFMSSHNLAEVERVCDRAGIIRKGKIVAIEDINSLKNKQIYTIRASFYDPINKDVLTSQGAEISREWDSGIELRAKGDISRLLGTMSSHGLRDITITHATLEEVFLEFYKN